MGFQRIERTPEYIVRRWKYAKSNDLLSLAHSKKVAMDHVVQARVIGWKAMEQSWQADLDVILARMSQLREGQR